MSDFKLLSLYALGVATLLAIAILCSSKTLAVLAGVAAGFMSARFDRWPGFQPRNPCKACVAGSVRPPRRGVYELDGGALLCGSHAAEAIAFGYNVRLLPGEVVPFPSVEGRKEARLMPFPSSAQRRRSK